MFAIDRQTNRLLHGQRAFLPATRTWETAGSGQQAQPVAAADAIIWLQGSSGVPLRAPVGVIGPNEARDEQLVAAEAVGALLASLHLTLLCGGRQGVMEAACRGAAGAGGMAIGLLPQADPAAANPFVTVAIASGIGEARNAIIAQASACLIAVGDSHGTLSEVALGLRLGKRVFGLAGAAALPGVVQLAGADALAEPLAACLLGLDR